MAEQLNFVGQDVSDDHLTRQFVAPPLSRRLIESVESDGSERSSAADESLNDALATGESLVFLGGGQSGKTSLAYYAAYKLAFDNWNSPSIPIYIDSRHYQFNKYAIRRALTSLYGGMPNGFDFDKAVKGGYFTLILDNIDPVDNVLEKLQRHIGEFSNCRWILVGSPNSDAISPDRLYNERFPDFRKYHIRELNRGRIRSLSRRWYADGSKEADDAYNLVMAQLIRDGLPRTPYMVSLLLWAIQQNKELIKVNEAVLLGNIVDHLIGKADFRLAKRGLLNPVGKEITLQNLARYLREAGGAAEENDVVSFLITFFDRKKLPYIGGGVLEKLVSCAVLKRDGSLISFKDDCFQDYFYAQLMRTDTNILQSHMKRIDFLDVRRELELLSGIRQQNDDLISTIMKTIDERVPERISLLRTN